MYPEGRIENVKRSLFSYIVANYSTTALQLQGSDVLDTTAITEWVWWGLTGVGGRTLARNIRDNSHGELATYLVTAEINVKPTTNITRIDAIADAVRNLLRQVSIPVTDYVGGTGVVGSKLLGRGVYSEQPFPIENDLQRHVILFRMQFLEIFAA